LLVTWLGGSWGGGKTEKNRRPDVKTIDVFVANNKLWGDWQVIEFKVEENRVEGKKV